MKLENNRLSDVIAAKEKSQTGSLEKKTPEVFVTTTGHYIVLQGKINTKTLNAETIKDSLSLRTF
jgi:hypothetical protein